MENKSNAQYFAYRKFKTFTHEEGLVSVPISANGSPTSKNIRLHPPTTMCKIEWAVVREGEPPIMPGAMAVVNGDSNYTFLRYEIGGESPMPQADNSKQWVMSGIYVYSMDVPRKIDSQFDPGALPFDAKPENSIPAKYFSNDTVRSGKNTTT